MAGFRVMERKNRGVGTMLEVFSMWFLFIGIVDVYGL